MSKFQLPSREPMHSLQTRTCAPRDLSVCERSQLHALMSNHFDNVLYQDFERDLLEKDSIAIVSDQSQAIVGFTTMKRLVARIDGKTVYALFSGDTVLEPEVWGTIGWARACGRFAAHAISQAGHTPVYWLLLTATHRSYQFLPAFFREYYPHTNVETPSHFKRLAATFLEPLFPDEFDSTSGLVRLKSPRPVCTDRVAHCLADAGDPHSRFFAEQNPGYLQGDFLVCVADLSVTNQTPLGRRFIADR